MLKIFILFAVCSVFAHAEQSRVVVITGASRGVGLAAAEHLAERGFTVYGATRNAAPHTQENIHFLNVDLRDEVSILQAIEAILDKEGRIDVLINNAGFALVGPLESLTQQEAHDQMEILFFAPIRMIQVVLPGMRERKSGRIINMSSTNAFSTPPFGSLYAAGKAALESLSESLSVEVQPYNILVSIVEPGLIQTHFSLQMGTREILNNPYRNIMDGIQAAIDERLACPELLFPSQSPKEIAEFLLSVIEDPHPKLRYQTSEEAKNQVSKKLLDLTGEIYLEEMEQYFGDK